MPLTVKCACAAMGRTEHHPVCPLWRPAPVAQPVPEEQEPNEVAPALEQLITEEHGEVETLPSPNDSEEEPQMARTKQTAQPATAREVREYLLANQDSLPEGVTVGTRGRLSQAAKDHFTKVTKRPIAE